MYETFHMLLGELRQTVLSDLLTETSLTGTLGHDFEHPQYTPKMKFAIWKSDSHIAGLSSALDTISFSTERFRTGGAQRESLCVNQMG
jgi:hypothetical protein